MFKTATTGTIKTIKYDFPSGFDVSAATRVIERSGIGSGSLSAQSSSTLIFTVTNPASIPAGTTTRLEIGRLVNSDTAGSFKVTITTENATPTIIDGPTLSPSFPIKDISENDVATSFMRQITLNDDTTGHAHGWNPDGVSKSFFITDISNLHQTSALIVKSQFEDLCESVDQAEGSFGLECTKAVLDGEQLFINIINTPLTSCCTAAISTTSGTNDNNFSPPSMIGASPFSSLH